MDSGQLVWIIIAIIVVLAIIALVVFLGRKRKIEAGRQKAAEIREQAREDEIAARDREAKAARAEADAQRADVEAQRLRERARAQQEEAEGVRASTQENLRKADELDPDVVSGSRDKPMQPDAAGDSNRDESMRGKSVRDEGVPERRIQSDEDLRTMEDGRPGPASPDTEGPDAPKRERPRNT